MFLHRANLEKAHAELEELYRRVKETDELKTRFFANVLPGQRERIFERYGQGAEDAARRLGLQLVAMREYV